MVTRAIYIGRFLLEIWKFSLCMYLGFDWQLSIQKEEAKKKEVHVEENVPAPSPRSNCTVIPLTYFSLVTRHIYLPLTFPHAKTENLHWCLCSWTLIPWKILNWFSMEANFIMVTRLVLDNSFTCSIRGKFLYVTRLYLHSRLYCCRHLFMVIFIGMTVKSRNGS